MRLALNPGKPDTSHPHGKVIIIHLRNVSHNYPAKSKWAESPPESSQGGTESTRKLHLNQSGKLDRTASSWDSLGHLHSCEGVRNDPINTRALNDRSQWRSTLGGTRLLLWRRVNRPENTQRVSHSLWRETSREAVRCLWFAANRNDHIVMEAICIMLIIVSPQQQFITMFDYLTRGKNISLMEKDIYLFYHRNCVVQIHPPFYRHIDRYIYNEK